MIEKRNSMGNHEKQEKIKATLADLKNIKKCLSNLEKYLKGTDVHAREMALHKSTVLLQIILAAMMQVNGAIFNEEDCKLIMRRKL